LRSGFSSWWPPSFEAIVCAPARRGIRTGADRPRGELRITKSALFPLTPGLSLLEQQRQRWARLDRTRSMASRLAADRFRVDDREAPLVELDPLRQELGTEAVALAGDRVDAHLLHRAVTTGSTEGLP